MIFKRATLQISLIKKYGSFVLTMKFNQGKLMGLRFGTAVANIYYVQGM